MMLDCSLDGSRELTGKAVCEALTSLFNSSKAYDS